MHISRVSPVTGDTNTLFINVTPDQLARWMRGELIQNVMPELTPDEREFLISGCTAEDWDKMFS